jgi:hypothetical protein
MQNFAGLGNKRGVLAMKSFSKILLAGAFAVIAIAVSAAPSEAARGKAKANAAATCLPLTTCTMAKTNVVHQCWGGKWQAMLLPACSGAGCAPPCPK